MKNEKDCMFCDQPRALHKYDTMQCPIMPEGAGWKTTAFFPKCAKLKNTEIEAIPEMPLREQFALSTSFPETLAEELSSRCRTDGFVIDDMDGAIAIIAEHEAKYRYAVADAMLRIGGHK